MKVTITPELFNAHFTANTMYVLTLIHQYVETPPSRLNFEIDRILKDHILDRAYSNGKKLSSLTVNTCIRNLLDHEYIILDHRIDGNTLSSTSPVFILNPKYCSND